MKVKDLSTDTIEQARKIYWNREMKWDDRMKQIIDLFGGVSERTARKWCAEKLNFKEKAQVASIEQIELAKTKVLNNDKNIFLVTSVQNASEINRKFLDNLKSYADFINAQLLIIPYIYHNRNNKLVDKKVGDMWFPKEVEEYLMLNRLDINENFSILGDVAVSPTAIMPLTNLESLTGRHSCCIGHPRVHMKSLPVFEDRPKIMFTTGTLSKPNFSNSKIGKISEFHSTYGALIIEKDGPEFYARQITAKNDGSFNDLYFNVNNDVVTRNKNIPAIIKGDLHYPFYDKNVYKESFDKLIPKIKPAKVFIHDLVDFKSINHHEANDYVQVFRNFKEGVGLLESEIEGAMNFLDKIKHLNLYIINSNHDRFLENFIINTDIRKASVNTLKYLEYAKIMLDGKAPKGVLAYLIEERFPNIKCLGRDESHLVKDIEVGCHGSDGIGGSKGSAIQFKSLNIKIITGHGHNVSRYDGSVQVGCNCLKRLGYNHSASSWVHSDVIIHNDGKIQTILYLGPNAEYTTLK